MKNMSGSSALFAALDEGTTQKVAKIDEATQTAESQLAGFEQTLSANRYSKLADEAEAKLAKATSGKQMTEEEMADARKKILSATLGSVREETKLREKDLQTAVYGLNGILNQIGEGYANLGKESPEDIALVERAENRLKKAEADNRNAETEMAVAKSKTALFWIRSRAVNAANQTLVECQRELAAAKEGVPEAKAQAARNARERLKNANIEEALDALNGRAANVLTIMRTSRENGKTMLEQVSSRKDLAFEARKNATEELEKFEEQLNALEVDIQEAEEALSLTETGSSEYTAKQTEITQMRQLMEDTRNNRNSAMVVANSKAEYAAELELDEKVLQRLIGNLEAWILQLSSATEERKVTFQARLQGEKLLSDQDAAQKIDEVGAKVDSQNRERMAEMAVAATAARQNMMSELPGRRKELANVEHALAQHTAEARLRDNEFLANFKDEFGIDPLDRSEFNTAEAALDELEAESI
jgi:SpoU rRNA methylase family enzyme